MPHCQRYLEEPWRTSSNGSAAFVGGFTMASKDVTSQQELLQLLVAKNALNDNVPFCEGFIFL